VEGESSNLYLTLSKTYAQYVWRKETVVKIVETGRNETTNDLWWTNHKKHTRHFNSPLSIYYEIQLSRRDALWAKLMLSLIIDLKILPKS